MSLSIQPSLATVRDVLSAAAGKDSSPNLIPLSATLSAEFLTPSSIYLKLAAQYVASGHFSWRVDNREWTDDRVKADDHHWE
jgi:hypothetical protein